jgi:2-oxoglutarate dehydrogenase E2 component (dihydrolipoamide succinyltransferase)
MAVDITVPSMGESITEGTLARWLKRDGDTVQADEPLYELETEKATTEIAAPAAGKLTITVLEGKTIAIGAVVGRIVEGAGVKAAPPKLDHADSKAPKAALFRPASAPAVPAAPSMPEKETILSPAARRLVDERGMDASKLTGTGRGGRITKEDVLSHLEQPSKPAAPPPVAELKPSAQPEAHPTAPPPKEAARETRQRMSSIRQRIADRLVASQKTTATLTTFNEADMTAIMTLRSRYKDRFREKHGVNLGFMSFFVKACVEALNAIPIVNAFLDGNDIVYHHEYHISIAVSTERGLFVPVLRNADQRNFAGIEKEIAHLAQKARDGKITVADLQGATFTITNGGVFGSLLSTPILNPPQSAILGMHTIQKRPVAIDDQVVIRPMMYLALSYDHRLIDGRDAVQFLVRVKECIENPERLMLEV